MNRNNEAHFNQIPETHISRSRFKRNQDVKFTFDAGRLIPFYVDEVLPGDTFSVDTAGIVRMTTPIFPVMDNSYLDVYYFFVPNRIVWSGWKEFMGENTRKAWANTAESKVPQIKITDYARTSGTTLGKSGGKNPAEGSILDYMGIPTKFSKESWNGKSGEEPEINALPVRGYIKIWNEWFRDQNVDDPIAEDVDDPNDVNYASEAKGITLTEGQRRNLLSTVGDYVLPVNKFHDYFTSCLPAPQKGPEVTIPMSANGPVVLKSKTGDYAEGTNLYKGTMWLNGVGTYGGNITSGSPLADDNQATLSGASESGGSVGTNTGYLAAVVSNGEATLNQLRQAFAVQHYYEALARGGSRYREIIRSVFGTTISDKTVQVPEYLGGGRYPINVSQVVQTSATTDNSPQGNASAISVTPFSENSFTKSFEEHGFVIGVCCVRHDRTYQQGIERFWMRSDKLDYYYPQFANLGEQAVKKGEIYAGSKTENEKTFGYQEAWADYRMKPNRVAGKFRSNATGTLDSWHYADNYSGTPTLSDTWMKEGKAEIQRTLAVQDEPQFIADFLIANNTTRPMPLYSVPGLEKL